MQSARIAVVRQCLEAYHATEICRLRHSYLFPHYTEFVIHSAGPIPAGLRALAALTLLNLSGNQISGESIAGGLRYFRSSTQRVL